MHLSIGDAKHPVRYTAFFCEENIWQLSKSLLSAGVVNCEARVLMLINEYGSVALQHQRAFDESVVGVWDYHVVLHDRSAARIFDLDSTLGCPVDAAKYFTASFPPQAAIPSHYRALVRAIPVQEYLDRFSSDRSHMLDADGQPIQAFPRWPAIASSQPVTLHAYRSCGAIPGCSELLPVDQYRECVNEFPSDS